MTQKLLTQVQFLNLIQEYVKSTHLRKKLLVVGAHLPHRLDPPFDGGSGLGEVILLEEGLASFLEEVFELEVEELEKAFSVVSEDAVDVDIFCLGLLENFLDQGGFPRRLSPVNEHVRLPPHQVLEDPLVRSQHWRYFIILIIIQYFKSCIC